MKPVSILKLKFPKRIGELIPIGEITLLSSLPGCGKSYSLLKFLNTNNIRPILFNLDHDATLQQFKLTGEIIKPKVLKNLVKDKYEDLKNEIVIIDTYQRAKEILDVETVKQQEKFTNQLLKVVRNRRCTIVVVGHPTDLVGKASIFKDNPSLVRNCYEHLHIDKLIDGRKTNAEYKYKLYINKGRGIGGAQVIDNWMRDDPKDK